MDERTLFQYFKDYIYDYHLISITFFKYGFYVTPFYRFIFFFSYIINNLFFIAVIISNEDDEKDIFNLVYKDNVNN